MVLRTSHVYTQSAPLYVGGNGNHGVPSIARFENRFPPSPSSVEGNRAIQSRMKFRLSFSTKREQL